MLTVVLNWRDANSHFSSLSQGLTVTVPMTYLLFLIGFLAVCLVIFLFIRMVYSALADAVYTITGRLDKGMSQASLLSIDVISSSPPCNQARLQLDSALPIRFQEGDTVVIEGTISNSTLHVISISK
jgi:hypothetical protein